MPRMLRLAERHAGARRHYCVMVVWQPPIFGPAPTFVHELRLLVTPKRSLTRAFPDRFVNLSPQGSALSGRCQPVREERQNLVACRERRLTSLVDQMLRHHTVRIRHVSCEEWCDIGIRCGVGKRPGHEAVAQRRMIGGKSLRAANLVARETIGEHG